MSSQDRDMPSKGAGQARAGDRKSTRLNSSHSQISYAVFCLKKKKNLCHDPSKVIHLHIEAMHCVLRQIRSATSHNSRFNSLDQLKEKIISVIVSTIIITHHK